MGRVFRSVAGFALIITGVFMLVLPGPGILAIAAGLALLARDMPWADRMSKWAKRKLSGSPGEPS